MSLTLFLLDGGFAGGHGRFDLAIGLIAMPWILLESALPDAMISSDLATFIIIPFVLNLGVLCIVVKFLRSRSVPKSGRR